MKNIPVFIFFVIIFSVFFSPKRGWAESSVVPLHPLFPFLITIQAQTGVLYGQGEEIVYADEAFLESQLLWDMKPLVYWGAVIDISPKNPTRSPGPYMALSFKAGVPAKTGIMEDRDWLAENHGFSHFSSHDNYTTQAFLLDYRLGFSLPLASKLLLKLHGNVSYMNFQWDSQDGYTQYAAEKYPGTYIYEDWNNSIPKTPRSGPAIRYIQQWLILSPGLSLSVPLFRFFSVDVDFQISPLIFASAQDNHWYTRKQYNDAVAGGLFLEPYLAWNFFPAPNLELSLYISYRYIKGSRGDTFEWSGNMMPQYTRQAVGAGYAAIDAGLLLGARF